VRLFEAEDFIGKDKYIGMQRLDGCFECPIHKHGFIELVYIIDGAATQTVDDVDYEVRRGDMAFINYGSTHSYRSKDGFSFFEVFFSPKLVEDGTITQENAAALLALSVFDDMRGEKNGGKLTLTVSESQEVEHILEEMLKENREASRYSVTVISSYLNILLTKMLRAASSDTDIEKDIWQSLKEYINTNTEEKMTLSSLAAKCFYNPSYFSRVFKQKFGSSPTEYIRSIRVRRAMDMLRAGDGTVEEVAEAVGFSDKSSFYHAFSKISGMTPAEYRANSKKKQP
jgi:AraC-like DNA-binding protein